MPHLPELFQKKKMEGSIAARKFKCTASEALALYPIVRRWLRTGPMPRGQCLPARKAFLHMAEVVDLLHGAQRTQPITPAHLLRTVEGALAACVQAGWEHNMIKKFHWLLHMPDSLERFGHLPACWTLERKHRMVSRYASTVRNTPALRAVPAGGDVGARPCSVAGGRFVCAPMRSAARAQVLQEAVGAHGC